MYFWWIIYKIFDEILHKLLKRFMTDSFLGGYDICYHSGSIFEEEVLEKS